MNRSRSCLMSVVISLCAVAHATTIASAGPSEAPTNAWAMTLADAEHARLVAMCGTWDVEMTFWFKPGGQGLTTKATSTIRSLFDGLFVEEKIEGTLNGTPFTTLGVDRVQHRTHQYKPRGSRARIPVASSRAALTTNR